MIIKMAVIKNTVYFSWFIFRIFAILVHKATDIWPVSSLFAYVWFFFSVANILLFLFHSSVLLSTWQCENINSTSGYWVSNAMYYEPYKCVRLLHPEIIFHCWIRIYYVAVWSFGFDTQFCEYLEHRRPHKSHRKQKQNLRHAVCQLEEF